MFILSPIAIIFVEKADLSCQSVSSYKMFKSLIESLRISLYFNLILENNYLLMIFFILFTSQKFFDIIFFNYQKDYKRIY